MHFGKAIIAQHTRLSEESDQVSILWDKIYAEFVEALDAHDNGISVYAPADTANLHKRFYDGGVSLGSLVGDLNFDPSDSSSNDGEKQARSPEEEQAEEDRRFLEASSLMGTTFLRKLSYYHRAWLPARTVVHAAYAARKSHSAGGRIMVFDRSVPWKDHLYSLEASHPSEEKVAYVLYPDGPHPGAKWRIQAVSVTKESFESRKPLPEAWRGLRDEKLDEVSGIDGGVFVHASGFIGGNQSFEGAMKMAVRGLEM